MVRRKKKPQMKPRKVTDDSMEVRSKSGQKGTIREEVWVNSQNEIVKYNLAYINFHLCQTDNGRVLGYDNAHGYHERHFMGTAGKTSFTTYNAKAKAFYSEVKKLKGQS